MNFKIFLLSALLMTNTFVNAQAIDSNKAKMKVLGIYDGGQPNVSIIKLLDPTDDVLCYVLMPDNAMRREVENGKWTYEGNSVGSISCLKVLIPVIPVKQK